MQRTIRRLAGSLIDLAGEIGSEVDTLGDAANSVEIARAVVELAAAQAALNALRSCWPRQGPESRPRRRSCGTEHGRRFAGPSLTAR
jgi:hypothetical protein